MFKQELCFGREASEKNRGNNSAKKLRGTWKRRLWRGTVWKFHDFPITHILYEINFGDSKSAKSAILTHLEALNFDFL